MLTGQTIIRVKVLISDKKKTVFDLQVTGYRTKCTQCLLRSLIKVVWVLSCLMTLYSAVLCYRYENMLSAELLIIILYFWCQ